MLVKVIVVLVMINSMHLYGGKRSLNEESDVEFMAQHKKGKKKFRWADEQKNGFLEDCNKNDVMDGMEVDSSCSQENVSTLKPIRVELDVQTYRIFENHLFILREDTIDIIDLKSKQKINTFLAPGYFDTNSVWKHDGSELYRKIEHNNRCVAYTVRNGKQVQGDIQDLINARDSYYKNILLDQRVYKLSHTNNGYVFERKKSNGGKEVVFGNFSTGRVVGIIEDIGDDFHQMHVSDQYVGVMKENILCIYGDES